MARQLLSARPGGKMPRFATAVAAFLALSYGSNVDATPITFAYQGTVTSVAALDPSNPFPVEPAFGTPFSGTFTFDSSAADGIPADASTGSYTSSGAPYNLTLSLGGLNFVFDAVNIGVTNGYSEFGFGSDEYLFGSTEADATFSAGLVDFTGALFSTDAQPLIAFPLTGLFSRVLFTDIIDDNQVEIAGEITSLTTVPEPTTILLMGAGVAGILRRRHRTIAQRA